MCFSAEASFISGALLSVAGIVSVKKVKKKSQILFAAIPLFFAVQQITEGFLWLSLKHKIDDSWQQPTTYLFLIFAQVFWPTWVPLSILFIEKDKKRKNTLRIVLVVGILVTLCLAYRLLTQTISAQIIEHHVFYKLYTPPFAVHLLAILYTTSIILPPFVSSIKKMKFIAIILFLSFIITKVFFDYYLVSVWCFFAALVSVAVFTIEHDLQNSDLPKTSPPNQDLI